MKFWRHCGRGYLKNNRENDTENTTVKENGDDDGDNAMLSPSYSETLGAQTVLYWFVKHILLPYTASPF